MMSGEAIANFAIILHVLCSSCPCSSFAADTDCTSLQTVYQDILSQQGILGFIDKALPSSGLRRILLGKSTAEKKKIRRGLKRVMGWLNDWNIPALQQSRPDMLDSPLYGPYLLDKRFRHRRMRYILDYTVVDGHDNLHITAADILLVCLISSWCDGLKTHKGSLVRRVPNLLGYAQAMRSELSALLNGVYLPDKASVAAVSEDQYQADQPIEACECSAHMQMIWKLCMGDANWLDDDLGLKHLQSREGGSDYNFYFSPSRRDSQTNSSGSSSSRLVSCGVSSTASISESHPLTHISSNSEAYPACVGESGRLTAHDEALQEVRCADIEHVRHIADDLIQRVWWEGEDGASKVEYSNGINPCAAKYLDTGNSLAPASSDEVPAPVSTGQHCGTVYDR